MKVFAWISKFVFAATAFGLWHVFIGEGWPVGASLLFGLLYVGVILVFMLILLAVIGAGFMVAKGSSKEVKEKFWKSFNEGQAKR